MLCAAFLLMQGAGPLLHAGGSVTYEEVAEVLPLAVRQHLEAAFVIPEQGDATRLGRIFTHLSGARMGPYTFEVQSKVGGGTPFRLTIYMDTKLLDGQGNSVEEPEMGVKIDETFLSYDVALAEPVQSEAPGPPPPLTGEQKAAYVKRAQDIYNELAGLQLPVMRKEFFSEAKGMEASLSAEVDGTRTVRRLKMESTAGDHGAVEFEAYYDSEQRLAFVLWTDSYWRFNPENPDTSVDVIEEQRFYFSPDGDLVRMLEKTYQGSGEAQINQNRDQATNKTVTPDEVAAFEFYKNMSNLALSATGGDPLMTFEDLIDASNMLVPRG